MKKLLNKIMNFAGYHIIKDPSLEPEIKRGKYKWLRDASIKTVIDVGANDGGFAVMINKILPDAMIYSFEPIRDVYLKLQANTSYIERMKKFNYALGEKAGSQEFNVNKFAPSSSFLKINKNHINSFPYTAESKKELVSMKTLDSFADEMQLEPNVLLKLDVQGFELNVLYGAPKILKNVYLILIEVSFIELYEKQPLFHDIYSFLEPRGFKYCGNLNQLNDPVTNRILQADAIFLRD